MKFVKVTRGHEVTYLNADHIHFLTEVERTEGSEKSVVTVIRFSLDVHDKIEVKERVEEILKQLQ